MERLRLDAVSATGSLVAVLLEPLEPLDRELVDCCVSKGRGSALVVNKSNRETGGGSLCVTSIKHGNSVTLLLSVPVAIYKTWNSPRVSTTTLNLFVHEMQRVFPPQLVRQVRDHGRGWPFAARTPNCRTQIQKPATDAAE